jgi:lysophospholipase L1-like esterase
MKIRGIVSAFILLFCSSLLSGSEKKTILSGSAFCVSPMSGASITVTDKTGSVRRASADEKGFYSVEADGMVPPLLIHALERGIENFSDESEFRGKSVAALVGSVRIGETNTANVNPLTDRVVSDAGKTAGFKSPVALILAGKTEGISPETVAVKTGDVRSLVLQALRDASVASPEYFDPCTTPQTPQSVSVLECIRHNRGYDSATGKVGDTMLFDINFRPLSKIDVLNYPRARKEKADLLDRSIVHVYIAADSTCSYYESERAPRAGWGQMFQSKFKENAKIMVVNAAQSGRSSRTFINEGWFRMIEETILPGDYLFIQFGHNDEKAGSVVPAARDKFDIANTATYPNDANGRIQGGDLSFQKWLEKYIASARAKKAVPVLLTPTTRIILGDDKKTGKFPIKTSVHINDSTNSGAKYLGDFSATIRDTAKVNNVPLIDIDAKSVNFANSLGEPGWKKYWLAADPSAYPFYKTGTTGNIDLPDNTHFQMNGASRICDLVVEGMRAVPSLSRLSAAAK